jgi:hypothetical protein
MKPCLALNGVDKTMQRFQSRSKALNVSVVQKTSKIEKTDGTSPLQYSKRAVEHIARMRHIFPNRGLSGLLHQKRAASSNCEMSNDHRAISSSTGKRKKILFTGRVMDICHLVVCLRYPKYPPLYNRQLIRRIKFR